jgi:hypothetical protein
LAASLTHVGLTYFHSTFLNRLIRPSLLVEVQFSRDDREQNRERGFPNKSIGERVLVLPVPYRVGPQFPLFPSVELPKLQMTTMIRA